MGPLEERRDGEGVRRFLDGEPVLDGMTLDLLLPGGAWLTGAYRQVDGRLLFTVAVGGEWERVGGPPLEAMALIVPRAATFRWPETRRSAM